MPSALSFPALKGEVCRATDHRINLLALSITCSRMWSGSCPSCSHIHTNDPMWRHVGSINHRSGHGSCSTGSAHFSLSFSRSNRTVTASRTPSSRHVAHKRRSGVMVTRGSAKSGSIVVCIVLRSKQVSGSSGRSQRTYASACRAGWSCRRRSGGTRCWLT